MTKGSYAWNNWIPVENMRGVVVHKWSPVHPHPMHRSHTDKTILLLRIEDKYVPIAEQAVPIISQVLYGCVTRHGVPTCACSQFRFDFSVKL